MSRLPNIPAISPEQFTVRPDRSVWSSRYARVIHGPQSFEGLACVRLLSSDDQIRNPDGLPARQAASIKILQLGFGIGTDLLAAIESVETATPETGTSPHQITLCERFPPSRDELRKLWAALGIGSALTKELIARWPAPCGGMHRLSLPGLQTGQPAVELTLAYGNPARSLLELSGPFDYIQLAKTAGGLYAQPGSKPGLGQLRRLSHAHTRVAGPPNTDQTRETLQGLGLKTRIDAAGWLGSWRSFTSNRSQAQQQANRPERFRANPNGTTAVVLGAGIAGLSVARALADLGMTVTVLEQNDKALLGGSAQPILAGHLHFSSDDNPLARLTRAAQALQSPSHQTDPIGRLQLLSDSDATAAAQLMLERLALPAELVRIVQAEEASELAGLNIAQSALWQSSTHILSPLQLASALPVGVQLKTNVAVKRMRRDRDEWVLFDQQDTVVAHAPTLVLCTGSVPMVDARADLPGSRLLPVHSIQTSLVAGQTTRLADRLSAQLRCVIGADSYACPLPDGSVLTGASYRPVPFESGALPVALTEEEQRVNINGWHTLTRAERTSADAQTLVLGDYGGLRHTTPDHLPLIGPVADEQAARQQWKALHRDDRLSLPLLPGVFMAGGFGSRGMLWSTLAATVLRDLISGAQPPIERSLIAAIAPHRFLRKTIRRFRTPDACNMTAAADSLNEGHATRTAHD